jgi:hypothetical protein
MEAMNRVPSTSAAAMPRQVEDHPGPSTGRIHHASMYEYAPQHRHV